MPETRNIICPVCNAVKGTVTLPDGKSAAEWMHALSGYYCPEHAPEPSAE